MQNVVVLVRRKTELALLTMLLAVFTVFDTYSVFTDKCDYRQYIPFVIPVFLIIMIWITRVIYKHCHL